MKKITKLALAAAFVSGMGAAHAEIPAAYRSIPTIPCPLGMFLTILTPSMVPSCVGEAISLSELVKMQSAAASVATSAASAVAGAATTTAIQSAATSAANDAIKNATSSAVQQQAAAWGGAGNMGSVSGFAGVTQKVISCDEYSSLVGGLTNPQNVQLSYEDLSSLGLTGSGEVENGWWATKLTYKDAATGVQRTAFGGAVIQYATLNANSGGNLQQNATIVSTGQCTLQVQPPCPGTYGMGYTMNSSYGSGAYGGCRLVSDSYSGG